MLTARGLILLLLQLAAFDCVLAGWQDIEARCELKADKGDPTKLLKGVITFMQKKTGGSTTIKGTITGFDSTETNQKHGFHIHEKGDLADKCLGAGSHYNPFSKEHGAPTDTNRHVGDLGNIVANNKKAEVEMSDELVKLSGETSVIGRSIVVHSGVDDLGKGGDPESKKTGNAGSRWSCCIITEVKYTILASCDIEESTGDPGQKISGDVVFLQPEGDATADLTVDIDLEGFDTSDEFKEHGFHVHANGATGNQCKDAGGHYNPENKLHGGPTDAERHVGDLGNVMEDGSGNVKTMITDKIIKISGVNSILGKAIVVHAKADDLGRGGKVDSNTTGAAGARLGCCIIKTGSPNDVTEDNAAVVSVLNWSVLLLSLLVCILHQ